MTSEPLLPVLSLVQNDLKDVFFPSRINLEELFDANNEKIYIGSDPKCQIRIPSFQVSRIHAIIKRRKNDDPPSHPEEEIYSYFLVTYSCGLRLNSLPINRKTEVRIQSGDLIDLVPASLRVKLNELPKKVTRLELENSRLSTQVESLKTELDVMKDQKESQVLSILKSEYSCVICNGVFIDPSSLPCGHTFCLHCLRQWLSRRKKCPICREPCRETNDPKKNVSISSMIEKTYGELLSSDNVRTKRADALKQREEEVKMAATEVSVIPPPPSFPHEMRRIADQMGLLGQTLEILAE